jgi:hypothetical protein
VSLYAHLDGIGVELETCVADSLLEWRRQHTSLRGAADLIAEHVYEVKTSLAIRPGGVAILTVQIIPKRSFMAHTECFRLKRAGDGKWLRSASSLPKP